MFQFFTFLLLVTTAWAQTECDTVRCQDGELCDPRDGSCVAVSCDAVNACRDMEGCVEQVCVTSPCPVKCSPCPVMDCPRPPENVDQCTARTPPDYVDSETGCTISPCTEYTCPNVCDTIDCTDGFACNPQDGSCAATSCDAENACRPEQGCKEQVCITSPCFVKCSACPVFSCEPAPENADLCTVRTPPTYVNEDGCEITPCPEYDCPNDCPDVMCTRECGPNGYLKGEDGCDTCECACGPVCMIACEHGNVQDEFGCDTCECKPAPVECPEIRCTRDCGSNGYLKDKDGCDTCECACGPVCAIFCEHGNVIDEYGCKTCTCKTAPACTSSEDCDECHRCDAGHCLFTERVFERDCNTCTCSRDGPDGPAFMCTEMACPQDEPVCKEGARKMSPDGCNTCVCACDDAGTCDWGCTKMYCPPEEEECPEVQCRMACEYGFKTDREGCEICECVTRDEFCETVRCPAVTCGRDQKEVRKGCCTTCEDVELAGDTCDIREMAKKVYEDDETNTYVSLKVDTECQRDTIQDSIDRAARALLRDAEADINAYVKASCCQDSTLKLVFLLQAQTRTEEEKAVKNIEDALLDPKSALRSEFMASPDSLEVVDSTYIAAASETGEPSGLNGNQQLGIALGALLVSIAILAGVSYHKRQKMQNTNTTAQDDGEHAMEEGTVEGIAMVDTSVEAGP